MKRNKIIILSLVLVLIIVAIASVFYYKKTHQSNECIYPECIDGFENGG